jgi:hypothetical protein
LRPGVSYLAILKLEGIERFEFTLPAKTPVPVTTVTAVSPSSREVPENLLRFYLHFSGPMQRGNAYSYVRLVDSRGEPVEDAFLELEEELWDAEGKRLTLLFDPGRIKSGLKPHIELGTALETGYDFELVIHSAWPDAEGSPLVAEHRHRFSTIPPDHQSPDPDDWNISAPRSGTHDELVVDLDEPLDQALLERFVEVMRGTSRLAGRVSVAADGRRWMFVPNGAWLPEPHQLIVDVRLEDLAGNRIDRLFERQVVDSEKAHDRLAEPAAPFVAIDFPVTRD